MGVGDGGGGEGGGEAMNRQVVTWMNVNIFSAFIVIYINVV